MPKRPPPLAPSSRLTPAALAQQKRLRLLGAEPAASAITPPEVYAARRQWLVAGTAAVLGAPSWGFAPAPKPAPAQAAPIASGLPPFKPSALPGAQASEAKTPLADVTSYNNFYEFGTDKADPAANAHTLKTRPWAVVVDGLVAKPKTFAIDDLLRLAPLEERVYRLRCVEAWSMVIPWIGYSLAHLLKAAEPLGSAKYVQFTSLADPAQMPGVRSKILDWPYVEALRLDEALHPLALLTFGLYGQVLPKQNGAPVRMVLPWKYGFKSGKSIVRITLTEKPPTTTWMRSGPSEYGFYASVNPSVAHPRWSQASERIIGSGGLFAKRKPTLMFNGYAEQVAALYQGMDLAKHF